MGIAVSDEILLSDEHVNRFSILRADYSDDGGQIISFIDAHKRLVAQRFDADGVQIGDDIIVAADADPQHTGFYPIFATSDGGFLQSYEQTQRVGNKFTSNFHVVRYDANGELLFDHVEKNDVYPSMTKLSNDGFIIFTSKFLSNDADQVIAEVFDAEGNKIAQRVVGESYAGSFTTDTAFDDGKWSADFRDIDGQHVSVLFDANGNTLVSIDAAQNERVKFNDDGSYEISSIFYGNGTTGAQRIFKHYGADGTLISQVSPPAYDYGDYFTPETFTELSNGNQVVLWRGGNYSESGQLHMRVLDSEGNMVVADTVLGETNIYQDDALVLPLSDGRWVVFWRGQQQIFNADGSKLGGVTAQAVPYDGIPANVQATDDGGWAFTHHSSGKQDLPAGIYIKTVHINDINNPPHAFASQGYVYEDHIFKFGENTLRGYDYDGDNIASVEIETLPQTGLLSLGGTDVHVGDVIAVGDLEKLKWTPQANLSGDDVDSFQFKVIDEHGAISQQAANFHLSITEVNDRPSGGDYTITIREDEKHIFTKDDFVFTDPDGNDLLGVDIKRLRGNAKFVVDNQTVRNHFVDLARFPGQAYFTIGKNEYGDNYATFKTRVTDNGDHYYGGHDTEISSHTLTVNVLPVNDAPQGNNISLRLNPGQKADFIDNYFQIRDVEGDHLKSIIIDALPDYGTFRFGNRALEVGDEIAIGDTDKLSFKADDGLPAFGSATLLFSIRDDGGTANGGVDIDERPNSLSFAITAGPKVIWGTEKNDRLTGDDGGNQIYGGAGNDVLFGAKGADVLRGGSGRDTFVFRNATGDDTIKDFEVDKDRIDLSGTSIDSIGSLHRHTLYVSEDRIYIYSTYRDHHIEKSSYLWLEGVHEHDLTEKNFIF